MWSPKPDEFLYVGPGRRMMAVPVLTEPAFDVGTPEELFALPDGFATFESNVSTWTVSHVRDYDVAPDGQRLVMVKERISDDSDEVVLVQNWTEELKRLVPTGN